jgi:hypothetical protein
MSRSNEPHSRAETTPNFLDSELRLKVTFQNAPEASTY